MTDADPPPDEPQSKLTAALARADAAIDAAARFVAAAGIAAAAALPFCAGWLVGAGLELIRYGYRTGTKDVRELSEGQ